MMTRKDYVAVAEILNTYKNEVDINTFEDLIEDFSEMFSNDNPNFKSDKFWEACSNDNE